MKEVTIWFEASV